MSNILQTYLKGFKLKMMVVEQKMTQPVDESTKLSESNKEPIEELDNLFNSIG